MINETPCIRFEDVTLRVGNHQVFQHTSWTIRKNQHWAIIGPNGAGKSVLANAISRRVPVIHGRIRYSLECSPDESLQPRSYLKRGEIVNISAETQRDLLQTYGGYHQARWQSFEGQDAPTVSELLTGQHIEHISPYEISPLRTDDAVYQKRREEAVALLGIDYLLHRKVFHISHGEGRKVLLARALMQCPSVLILDDPFCGLDTESRSNLMDILNAILRLNTFRVIVVASRVDEIPDNITHIARVESHQIRATGTRQQLLSHMMESMPAKPLPKPFQTEPLLALPPAGPALDMSQPLIEMRKVSVSYGDVQVLQDITWTMQWHQHWAIVGANGAGKTTLLSLILADNPRSYANDIRLFGRRRGSGESIWDIKRHIGWVSPELHLYYHQPSSCQAVVASGFFDSIGLYRQCSPEQNAAALHWMKALGIDHVRDYPLCSISTGEQRLVLLARALVKSPVLLILDEPCQGLDRRHRNHILETLDFLCTHTGVHLMYVTHYWHEMPVCISHVMHLSQGRIDQLMTCKQNLL